jgi:hypothetical protein
MKYDLELSRRLWIIKSSRVTSRVKSLNGKKKQSFEYTEDKDGDGPWNVGFFRQLTTWRGW